MRIIMNYEKIFLVVQSCGYKKKYRLGINTKNSQELFKQRGVSVRVILSKSSTVNIKTTCGTPNNPIKGKRYKKGYDFFSKEISDWIIENNFHCYEYRKPTKLEFEHYKINSTHNLKYTGKVERNTKCREF